MSLFVRAFHVCESKGGLYVNVKLHFSTAVFAQCEPFYTFYTERGMFSVFSVFFFFSQV